jgi:MoxR-like ATPase
MPDPAAIATPEQARAAIEQFRADCARVREQVARIIVGHDDVIDGVLVCLFTGGHVLLEGVPGLGKTLLIRTLAGTLNLSFNRIQFTPDLMPADISGTTIVVEVEGPGGVKSRQFSFQRGPIFAQMVLADEINRATPKTQSALLEAMQEKSVTVGGTTYRLELPFFVMATQNPIEQEGTYPLPEAQLDRFFFKLLVGYSGREEMAEILARTTTGARIEVQPVMGGPQILEYQRLVQRGAIAPHVQDYAVRAVLATHPKSAPGATENGRLGAAGPDFSTPMVNRYLRFGASPRAAQSLVLAAKCQAMLEGRAAASIDDIRKWSLPALRHRIILNFEAEAEGVTPDAVIRNVLDTIPVRME